MNVSGAALDVVKTATGWLATGVEAAAAIVIALAVLRALWGAGTLLLRPDGVSDNASEGVRLRLARWLAVALEFALAADILRTAVAPSWDEIGKLAAIAALRTLLNYFLQREIDSEARRDHGGSPPS
ncbi:DUF1622 domain-containing protein [Deinococcus aquiradiocola]|uniref:DUF1622 domain-containing protein n=1 Tax=Deinococcus aquiradiocola TaxID=393059 RepID=A0A917P710_9DEIO|nr:DUF1622 domain-containing protein [Deinococcus aquiradiocola]GGJ64887.1 hypothetical protein GCM10008939_05950 [Deinococcus aquiradiocola]